MKQLTQLEEIQGKTVRGVANDFDCFIVAFTDESYIKLYSQGGYYGEHSIAVESDPINWLEYGQAGVALGLVNPEWLQRAEAEKQLKEHQARELQDKAVYLRLKRKFEN